MNLPGSGEICVCENLRDSWNAVECVYHMMMPVFVVVLAVMFLSV